MFLHEAHRETDFESALGIKQFLDVFNLKNGTVVGKENEQSGITQLTKDSQTSLKTRVRDHVIWKDDKIWNHLLS